MLPARLLLLALAALLAAAAPAAASPGSGPTAIVSIGDSYISGEAGRWEGNSINPVPPHDGTDRGRDAYVDGTDESGCHRSDVAEVLSADVPVDERINLACSGAESENVFRASQGGQVEHGEAPQADKLLPVAREKDVEMIVVSVGGNDLGFASIVLACITAYAQKSGPCRSEQQKVIDAKLAEATAGVERAIDEIRAVMARAGYRAKDYRLVLQTYPSVVPRAAEARYAEADQRRATHGCPFYDADLDWARDEASRQIGAMVKRAARARGAEWLEVGDLFQGHEVCSASARQSTGTERPDASAAEWGRMVSPSALQQGERQELFHPNAIGQRALGACVTALYAAGAPGTFSCSGTAGIATGAVGFGRHSTLPPARRRTALRLRAARVARQGGRTCGRFTVTVGGRPVRGATVRFAGRRARTGRTGRVRLCARTSARRVRAVATKPGYRKARRTVRVRRYG